MPSAVDSWWGVGRIVQFSFNSKVSFYFDLGTSEENVSLLWSTTNQTVCSQVRSISSNYCSSWSNCQQVIRLVLLNMFLHLAWALRSIDLENPDDASVKELLAKRTTFMEHLQVVMDSLLDSWGQGTVRNMLTCTVRIHHPFYRLTESINLLCKEDVCGSVYMTIPHCLPVVSTDFVVNVITTISCWSNCSLVCGLNIHALFPSRCAQCGQTCGVCLVRPN